MRNDKTGGKLLVPIANPETVDRLMNTATDIASERSMTVLAIHVVEVPPQVPLSMGDQLLDEEIEQLLEYAEECAEGSGVEVETKVRYARDTATGIVGSVDAYDGDSMLVGWRGRPRRRDIVLGSFLDRVLAEAPCDVYVQRIRSAREVPESILVPVAGGPHDELAAELAGTLAARHDAPVTLLYVTSEDGTREEEEIDGLLERRREHIPETVEVDRQIERKDHVAGAITDASASFDLIVLGATRDPFLDRKLVGSVAQGVGRTAECPVIVTRRSPENAEQS